jgi:hypothetical protein
MTRVRWPWARYALAVMLIVVGASSAGALAGGLASTGTLGDWTGRAQGSAAELDAESGWVSQASEHYWLTASEVGYAMQSMRSDSYGLSEGLAEQAEAGPPMVSESYRMEGVVRYWHAVPLVASDFP